jgi:GT2 family glycosyltransferase
MKNKLGIGYITCDAPERISSTYPNIPKGIGELVVVNSGCILDEEWFPQATEIIQSGKKISVSVAKNRALRYLMNQGCDHMFIIEDDVVIKDAGVFGAYLKAAEASGIWHLNYALQGPLNRAQDSTASVKSIADMNALNNDSAPAPRAKLEYENGSKLAFYPHAIGSFQYFYRGIVKNVGYFDERYENAFENVDYMYRVIEKGLHPPYWWFADIDNSEYFLDSLDDCMTNSRLRESETFGENMLFGKQWGNAIMLK